MRALLRLLLLAGALGALIASAQDGGPRFGFTAGAPLGPFDPNLDTPLWVDSAQRVYSQLPNQQGVRCYQPDGGSSTPGPVGDVRLFAGEGSDTVVFMVLAPGGNSATFWQSTCDAPQALGTLSAPTPGILAVGGGVQAREPDGALLYGRPEGVVRIGFSPSPTLSLLVTRGQLLSVVRPDPRAVDGGTDDPLRVVAVRRNAAGGWVLVVERREASGALYQAWVLELTQGALLARRWGPDAQLSGLLEGLIDLPGLGASVVSGYRRWLSTEWNHPVLALVPHVTAPLRDRVPPWPVQPSAGAPLPENVAWRRLIGSSTGVPRVVGDAFGQLFLYPLAFDARAADFDRDGLRALDEADAGTSDFQADTDQDGVPDGLERLRYGSDPSTGASQADAGPSADELVLAPSILMQHWPELPPADCLRPLPGTWGSELCFSAREKTACSMPPTSFTCLDEQLRPMAQSPLASAAPPRFLPGGEAWWRLEPSTFTWKGQPRGGMERDFPAPFVGDSRGALPLDATHAVFVDQGQHAAWRTDGASAFAVVDSARVACPILPDAAALTRCADFPGPRVRDVMPLGFDRERGRVVLSVTTEQGVFMLGVGVSDVAFMGDLLPVTHGTAPQGLSWLAGGGAVLHFNPSLLHGDVRLGANLQPVGWQPPMVTEFPLPPFRGGLRDTTFESYEVEPVNTGPGSCITGGWGDLSIFICDTRRDNEPPQLVTRSSLTRWLPVGPGVQPGEVLFWSYGRYHLARGNSVGFLGRDGGAQLPEAYQRPEWLLWRYTPEGAVVEWLTAEDFVAAMTPEDRADLARAPLGDVHDLAVSPNGLELCLVEPAAGRAWTLSLDAQTRRLSGVRLAATGAVTACGYGDDGGLAWAGGAPSSLHVDGRTVSLGLATATGLVRSGGRFVVQGDGEPVRCVGDDGVVSIGAATLTALGEAQGDVAMVLDIGDAGIGGVGTASRLCAGGGLTEFFLHPAVPFWTGLYNPLITPRTANAKHGSIAVRPDGLLLAAPRDIEFTGLGGTLRDEERPVVRNYLFHVFPRYAHLGAERLAQFDGQRLTRETISLAGRTPLNVGAMALIPGAPRTRDWGYAVRPGTAAADVNVTPDAGILPPTDAGAPVSPPQPPMGCAGCSAAELGLAPLLLLALSSLRSQRKRRRGPQ